MNLEFTITSTHRPSCRRRRRQASSGARGSARSPYQGRPATPSAPCPGSRPLSSQPHS